ncbi:hypothetical protein [Paenibacillus roseipurpureus]|uniref:Uncharacterized protein n=1 Tax=Paenibacillus roseopurpureus TaxID=2918901 RepID=A0AA96LM85_9BACL|nr:hypothetical protein [Paenibacillus sp. MBLB1832]WNR42399.1 hypothetical protein MJB10_14775 [Paenibacillus sp. MBLB1832]
MGGFFRSDGVVEWRVIVDFSDYLRAFCRVAGEIVDFFDYLRTFRRVAGEIVDFFDYLRAFRLVAGEIVVFFRLSPHFSPHCWRNSRFFPIISVLFASLQAR